MKTIRGFSSAALALAVGAAAHAADAGEASAPLPPGARSPAERAFVDTREAPYGPRFVEPLADGAPEQRPPADELEYTVDPALEAQVRGVLAEGRVTLGHVLVMDPDTGELLAYVSTDPGRFPATRAYPTASLMKIVTAAAVLRYAPAAAGRTCRTEGSPYVLVEAEFDPPGTRAGLPAVSTGASQGAGGAGHQPDEGAGPGPVVREDSFRSALAISNNQCFARHAVRDLGEQKLREEMQRVGMLESPAPAHPAGEVAPVETPLDLGNLGSGLAGSALTPLAAVRLAGLLANGRLASPWWVATRFHPDGPAFETHEPEAPRPAWTPELATMLREHLREVVVDGTARRAFLDEDGAPRLGSVGVAGKTGTLRGEDPSGLYQWFVGVAPADAPELAIAALVVHPDGEQRAESASRIAAGVLEAIFCPSGAECDPQRAAALVSRGEARAVEVARLRDDLAAAAAAAAAEAEAAREGRLDAPLRPIAPTRVDLPAHLRRRRWAGEVVLRIEVDPQGHVVGASVASSDLPRAFGTYLSEEVRGWQFDPPLRNGRPVSATALVPIPVRVD